MRVLVACECSGRVRDAFIANGHDAVSCDLQPCEVGGPHYQGDVLDILRDGWDLLIAHPPCTYLCVTGNKWFKPEYRERFPTRVQDRQEAIDFFLTLYHAPIPRVAVENPVGVMSSVFRKPDQYVHPYYFSDPAPKKTGLWLRGLPLLVPTDVVEPEYYIYKDGRRDPMWHVQSMRLPADERARVRSRTFPGFAKAMADQWGGHAPSDN